MNDPVEHPRHYCTHPSGVECIEITEHMNFCVGNAIKYLWRAGQKGSTVEDLRKARWYLDREISRLEKVGAGEDVVKRIATAIVEEQAAPIIASPAPAPVEIASTAGPYPVVAPAPEKPTRTCLDCGADISDRHGKATRCPKHAQEALRAQKRDSWRRRHGAVKAVKAAPPAPKAPQKRKGAAEERVTKKRAPALIRDASAKGKRSPDPVIEGMRAQLAKTVRKVDPIEEQARQSTTKRGGTPGRPGPRPASEVVAARDVGGTVML